MISYSHINLKNRLKNLFPHRILTKFISVLTIAYMIYYLWWRYTFTLNADAMTFSLVFLGAEVYSAVVFVLFAFMVWEITPPFRPKAPSGFEVDVFIPTYDENIDILEATLVGCNLIKYPHNTYLLDDGHRPEMESLTKRLGCNYISRPTNEHAKAGNINYALTKTGGDFIVILDADFVPQPDILDKTLGYFTDKKVAVVQLPQEFHNMDSIQHTKKKLDYWHDQSLFYNVIQPGKNRHNGAFWCGNPSVVRRKAIESVGGIATETITEDIHTSIRLHAAGWKIIYSNDLLAFGIAPHTLHAFLVQRLRWAEGSMQLLRSRENPFLKPGLTIAQRFSYFASMSTYLDSFQRVIYIFIPLIVLITGVLPVDKEAITFFTRWIPFFFLGQISNYALGRKFYKFLEIEKLNIMKMYIFMKASLILIIPKKLTFKVTPKSVDETVYAVEKKRLQWHFGIIILTIIVLAIGILNFFYGVTAEYESEEYVLVAMFWSSMYLAITLLMASTVVKRRHERQHYRFPVDPVNIFALAENKDDNTMVIIQIIDVSRYGANIAIPPGVKVGKKTSLKFNIHDGVITIDGTVVHKKRENERAKILGFKFDEINEKDKQRFLAFLFVYLPRRHTDPDYVKSVSAAENPNDFTMTAILKRLHEKSPEYKKYLLKLQVVALNMATALKLSSRESKNLLLATIFHDIGKIAVSEEILNKTTELDEKERVIIKKHVYAGYKIAAQTEYLADVAGVIGAHHESWDGTGYPKGLKGKEIPFLARIISIIDTYDAMISDRPYKEAINTKEALEKINELKGRKFDPELTRIFTSVIKNMPQFSANPKRKFSFFRKILLK